jgi:hypothetical protein
MTMKDHHPAEAPVAWQYRFELKPPGCWSGWAHSESSEALRRTLDQHAAHGFKAEGRELFERPDPELAALRDTQAVAMSAMKMALTNAVGELEEAEATLARVRALADRWADFPPLSKYTRNGAAAELRAALEGRSPPMTKPETEKLPRLPPLPQAFFDEFGASADDRVQDYAHAYALAAIRAKGGGEAVEFQCRLVRLKSGRADEWRTCTKEAFDSAGGMAHEGRAFRVEYRALYTTPAPAPPAMEKDAARYRFWRDAMVEDDGAKRAAITRQKFPGDATEFDAAIDAAIAAHARSAGDQS